MERKNNVQDKAAVKSVGAVVIMKGGEIVARVLTHFGPSLVTVNILQSSKAAAACVAAGFTQAKVADYDSPFDYQAGTAGGGGYDKRTAALSGMVVDGHKLTNHCGESLPKPEGKSVFPVGFEPPPGFSLANYVAEGSTRWPGAEPATESGYTDCYRKPGLEYLAEVGYQIILVL